MDMSAQLNAWVAQGQQIQQQQADTIQQLRAEVAQLRGQLAAQAGQSAPGPQPDLCQQPAQHDARVRQEYKRLRDAHARLQVAHGTLLAQHADLQERYSRDSEKWQVFNEWWASKVDARQKKIDARKQRQAAAATGAAPAPAAANAASSSRSTKQHLSPSERAIVENVGLQLEAAGGSKKKSSRSLKRAAPPETPTPAAPLKRSRAAAADSAGKAGSSTVLRERVNAQPPLAMPVAAAAQAGQDVDMDEADVSGVKHAGSPAHSAPLTSSGSSTVVSKDADTTSSEALPAPPAAQPVKAAKVVKREAAPKPDVARNASPEAALKEPKTPGPQTQDRMDLESRVQALRLAQSNRKAQEALSPTKSVASPSKPAPAAAQVKPKLPNTPAVPDAAPPRPRKSLAAGAPTGAAKAALQKLLTAAQEAGGSNAADRSEELSIEERKKRRRELNRLRAEELAKDPFKYKGHGRYAKEVEGAANRTINSEYEIDPARNGGVAFPHKDVVRNKAERKQMHAHDCPCCSEWYAAVGYPNDKDAQAHKQAASRHRAYGPPASTPPHYWQIGFPDSPEALEINRKAEIEHEKRRRQMDVDPRYKKRGEGSRR